MKVEIDRDRCVASGQCVLAAPAVFDQREDDGMVILLTEDLPPDQVDGAREAAFLCPAQVITVIE
jgi:ferredoxin